jgi:hypothetical protein
VLVFPFCVEPGWANAIGAMSAPQARIAIVFLSILASFVVPHGYAG